MLTAQEAYEKSMEYREDIVDDIFTEIEDQIEEDIEMLSTSYKFENKEDYDLYAKKIVSVLTDVYSYDVKMDDKNCCLDISWDFMSERKDYQKACEGCMNCMVKMYYKDNDEDL